MFDSKTEVDAFGKMRKHYYLTQGDSQYIYVYPKNQHGEIVMDNITDCDFKLAKDEVVDCKYVSIYSQKLVREEDRFALELTSDDTSALRPATYRYQFDIAFVDGSIQTLQGFFTITPVVA